MKNSKKITKENLKPDKYTYSEKIKIAKELKPITREEVLKDYKNLVELDLNDVKANTHTGNKVIDYFTYPERLNTKGYRLELSYFEVMSNKSYFEKKPYITPFLI